MRFNRAATVAATTVALAAVAPATAALASVDKSTFTGVTLTDGDGTRVGDAVITASVKTTKKSTFTVCDYYTTGFATYLGQFGTATGPGADLEQFCLDNYPSRVE